MMGKATENKVRYGVKNVAFAPQTEVDGVLGFEKPIPFKGAIALSLEALGETTTHYADDGAYFVVVSNNGYEGTYEVSEIPIEFRTQILGEVLLPNGLMVETANARLRPFALLFEFDGDQKPTRHVLYNCTASRPGTSSTTKGESVEVANTELNFVAAPKEDGIVKARTTATVSPEIYNDWYNEVLVVSADDLTAAPSEQTETP